MVRRRLFAGILLLLLPLMAFGQASEFSKAVKKNKRSASGYYFVDLSRKEYSRRDIENFARNNGYVIYNLTEGTVSAYGNLVTIVKSVEMLPKGEAPVTGGSGNVVTEVAADRGGDVDKILGRALDKGLRDGSDKNGVYAVLTRSGIPDNEIREACNRKNLYFLNSLSYYKDPAQQFIFFVPQSEMASWVLKHSFDFSEGQPSFKKGSVMLFDGEVVNDVLWSGQVSDGKINGKGVGAKFIDPGKMLVFQGNFRNGKLDGEGYYRYGLPEEKGFFRIAAGRYESDIMTGAGEYAKTYPASDGVIRMERAFYNWDVINHKPFTQYEESKGRYHSGTRWYYVDEDFHRLFSFPSGTFKEERGFQNGVAVVKHCPVEQWKSYELEDGIWIEYNVDKRGVFSFTENQKQSLRKKYGDLIGYDSQIRELFKAGFISKKADFLTGFAVPEMIRDLDNHVAASQLASPSLCLSAQYPDWEGNFGTFKQLVRLYQLVFSEADDYSEWNFEGKTSRAKSEYERQDYGYRKRFNTDSYYHPQWMNQRLNEGLSITQTLRSDNNLQVQGKTGILDKLDERLRVLETEYRNKYYAALHDFYGSTGKMDLASELKGDQIDENQSHTPRDLKKYTPAVGSDYYTFETDGVIRFKRGSDYVKYNVRYDSDMEVDYYLITYCSMDSKLNSKQYKNSADMLSAVISAYIATRGSR